VTPHPFATLVRRLDAEASKAPWRAERMPVGTCLAVRAWHGHDGHELFATRLVRGRHSDQMYGDDWRFCGESGEGHSGPSSTYVIADARAIVTLRNAAPDVAALVEAAGLACDCWFGQGCETETVIRMDKVRAALDALARAARDATSGPADPTRIEGGPK